jgi:hypothetical protein
MTATTITMRFAGPPQSGDFFPQPVQSPGPALKYYTRHARTLVQAYRAQVYSNDRKSQPLGKATEDLSPRLEILEVDTDTDGARRDLDFNRSVRRL